MLIKTLLSQNRIVGFPIPSNITNDILDQIRRRIKDIPPYPIAQEPDVTLSASSKIVVEGLVKHIQKQKNSLL